jgi:hypothetical protein
MHSVYLILCSFQVCSLPEFVQKAPPVYQLYGFHENILKFFTLFEEWLHAPLPFYRNGILNFLRRVTLSRSFHSRCTNNQTRFSHVKFHCISWPRRQIFLSISHYNSSQIEQKILTNGNLFFKQRTIEENCVRYFVSCR